MWAKGKTSMDQRGLTLVELLIALVLTAIIGGAVYQGLINQSRTFILQDQSAETQQNCRAASENVIREIRMAGYAMPYIHFNSSDPSDPLNNITFNDQGIVLGTSLKTINNTTLNTNNDSSRRTTDALFIRRGDGVPWTIRHYLQNYNGNHEWCKVTMDERYPIREGDPAYVLVISRDKKEFCTFTVMGRGLDEDYVNKKKLWTAPYSTMMCSDTDGNPANEKTGEHANYEGGTVIKFSEIAFYIDTSSGVPTLMKAVNAYSSQIVARYIEDLQVAYENTSGTWYYDPAGTPNPTINNIRNVRVNILARSSMADSSNSHSHEAMEDGLRHPSSGADGYRRRSMVSQIRLRNFGVD